MTVLIFREFTTSINLKLNLFGKHFNTAMDLYEPGVDTYTFMKS